MLTRTEDTTTNYFGRTVNKPTARPTETSHLSVVQKGTNNFTTAHFRFRIRH